MKIAVAKVGMELVDKLTGIAYQITATEEPTKGTVIKAEATEILDEDETREPKKVTITDANDITFRVTKWVDDVELHTANVVNGILAVDGRDVVMGSIVAKKVIKVFPGVVIFTAEDPEGERDAVYQYTPSRDKMDKLGSMEADVSVVEDSETRVILAFSFTKEIEVEEDGQKKTDTVFDRAGIYVLTKNRLDFEPLMLEEGDRSFDDYDEYDDEDDSDDDYTDNIDLEGFLGFDVKNVVVAQGDKYFYIPVIDDEKNMTYVVYRITNTATFNGSVEMPGKLTAVTANNTAARNLGKAIFSGEGFVKIDNVVIRSNELNGYIYLVDARRDREHDVNTYVLATEDRKIKTAVRKNTKDRGEIITIEG